MYSFDNVDLPFDFKGTVDYSNLYPVGVILIILFLIVIS